MLLACPQTSGLCVYVHILSAQQDVLLLLCLCMCVNLHLIPKDLIYLDTEIMFAFSFS